MAFDTQLAESIRLALAHRIDVVEKKMMGGLTFMVNDKMSVGIIKDNLLVRVLPSKYEETLALPFAKPMQFTGRIMKGFIQVEPPGFETEEQLQFWVETGIEFAEKGVLKSPKKRKSN